MSVHSAVQKMNEYGRRFPGAWKIYASYLTRPLVIKETPSWCWLPEDATNAVVYYHSHPEHRADAEVRRLELWPLHAMAAWRATQGIYRMHPTLLAELLETKLEADLPVEFFKRLPEWCVYIETPGVSWWGEPLHGFWAFLNYWEGGEVDGEVSPSHEDLVLVLDGPRAGSELMSFTIALLGGNILDGLSLAYRSNAVAGDEPPDLEMEAFIADSLSGLVSCVLYLCADEAEYQRVKRPLKVVNGRKRPLLPCPKQPTIHPTGTRLGAALDAARARYVGGATGGGPAVAPHIRRAHWHHFWVGPRNQPAARHLALKWLPPIPVNLSDVPEVATVRPVLGPESSL